jgi:sugar phosphate permease
VRFSSESEMAWKVSMGIWKTPGYRWLIFWIFGIQYILLFFHRVCPAILAPEFVKAFNVSGVELGILSSAYFYPYAFMQVPIGMLSDRWGARKTASIFGLVAVLGIVLFAVSGTFHFATFSRVLVGLGVSAIFVPGMKAFTTWFDATEYARVSGLFIAIGSVGWLAGTTPLAMLSQRFDWREIFIAIAFITFALTALTWFMVVDNPEKKGFYPPGQERKGNAPGKTIMFQDIIAVFLEKDFWPIAAWFFLRVGIIFGFFGLWAGPYLMDTYGFSKLSAGNILLTGPLAIIVGSPFLGYVSDRLVGSRKKVMVASSVIHAACWVIMLAFHGSLSPLVLCLIFFIMGLAAGSPGNVGFAAIKELFPVKIAGTSIGAANLFAFLGGMVYQPIIGCVLDKAGRVQGAYSPQGYRAALWIFLITSLGALLGALLCRERVTETTA